MKKVINVLLVILISVCLFGCGQNNNDPIEKGKVDITVEEIENGKRITFSKMLTSAADLQQLDLTDQYQSVCAIVFALAAYEDSPTSSKEMLEYINGPEDVSEYDIDFIKNQIEQYPYVMRSYFDGTSPQKDYEIKNISISVYNDNQSIEEGYARFWLESSGADNKRSVMLRLKASTEQWFLFSDTYKGLMAGIRKPASEDKWA